MLINLFQIIRHLQISIIDILWIEPVNPSHYLHRTLQDEHPLSLHTNLTLFLLGETSLYMLNQKDYHVSYLFMHDVNRTHRGFGVYFVCFYVQDCLYLGEVGFFREEILEFL